MRQCCFVPSSWDTLSNPSNGILHLISGERCEWKVGKVSLCSASQSIHLKDRTTAHHKWTKAIVIAKENDFLLTNLSNSANAHFVQPLHQSIPLVNDDINEMLFAIGFGIGDFASHHLWHLTELRNREILEHLTCRHLADHLCHIITANETPASEFHWQNISIPLYQEHCTSQMLEETSNANLNSKCSYVEMYFCCCFLNVKFFKAKKNNTVK